MARIHTFAALATTLLITACAKAPGSITPLAVSSQDFVHMSCEELAQEIDTNLATLEDAERRQRNALAADTAGVFFVLIPPSVFTGDAEDEVALAKGNDIALRRALEQNCADA